MDKICPIMSALNVGKSAAGEPAWFVDCQKEKCQLWVIYHDTAPKKNNSGSWGQCGLIKTE